MNLDQAIAGLTDADKGVRMHSADFLDHHGDDRCIDALLAATRDPSPDVRRHALHSLGCQACKSTPLSMDIVPHLIRLAVEDSSIRVRRAAVHMLGNQNHDPRIVDALERILTAETDRKLRFNAQWALSQQRGPGASN